MRQDPTDYNLRLDGPPSTPASTTPTGAGGIVVGLSGKTVLILAAVVFVAVVAGIAFTNHLQYGNPIKFHFTGSVKGLDDGKVYSPAEADALLTNAARLGKIGRKDEAVEKYNEIITKYAGSAAAQEARRRLDEMQAGGSNK